MKILIQAMAMGFLVGAMFMAGTKAADWAIPDKPRAALQLELIPEPENTPCTAVADEIRVEI